MTRVFSSLFAVALICTVPSPAYPCGDGDGGDSGGGGDSGDGGDYSAEPACVDSSDIVGRAQCRRFGSWDVSRRPRLRFGIGTSMHSFSMTGMNFSGVANHDPDINYRVAGENMGDAGQATAGSVDIRVTAGIGQYLFAGGQISLGGMTVPGRRTMASGALLVDTGRGFYGSFGGIVGASLPLGKWLIRGETQVGYRLISMTAETEHLDCIDESGLQDGQWQIRPRLGLERWITPWLTAGGSLSRDVLRDGDLALGLFIGGYLRSFDATR